MDGFDRQLFKLVKRIPKTELHIHLEGAIPAHTLLRFIKRKGAEPGPQTVEDLKKRLEYTDFGHFIETWTWKNTFILEERDFYHIAYDSLEMLHQHNVKYVEAFYSPGDYWRQDLQTEGITECLLEGVKKAEKAFGIRCRLICDLIRDHGPETGMKRLDEIKKYVGKGVIGIGIGGSEKYFPCRIFKDVYDKARQMGFHTTAHAGEVCGAESVRDALEVLKVERIGHGTRAHEDPALVEKIGTMQIPMEMCLVSNVKTRVCKEYKSHPFKDYYKKRLLVTVNSDDPVMFDSNISEEYYILIKEMGLSFDDLERISLNGIKAAFASDEEKRELTSIFKGEWDGIRTSPPGNPPLL